MTVSIVEAKAHLGIRDDHQDALVEGLMTAATDACLRFIGSEDQPDPLPPIFEQAVLMTLAAFYEDRDNASLPDGAQALLLDLRPWVFA